MSETLAKGRIIVNVKDNVVAVSIECRDTYEAYTLFDDILARLHAGDKVSFSLNERD